MMIMAILSIAADPARAGGAAAADAPGPDLAPATAPPNTALRGQMTVQVRGWANLPLQFS